MGNEGLGLLSVSFDWQMIAGEKVIFLFFPFCYFY